MSHWDSDYIGGPVIIENGGLTIKAYRKSGGNSSFSFNGKRARCGYWSGDYLIVEMEDGDRRRIDSGGGWTSQF